jgi:hypothetical protein
MSTLQVVDPPREAALRTSASALRRASAYRLPPELDRRILDLGERKESLTPDERAELMAWVAFTQERSLEKVGAELALRRLTDAFPEIGDRP